MASSSSPSRVPTPLSAAINLPVGFQFFPNDKELVNGFLIARMLGNSLPVDLVDEINVYGYDPEQLPRYPETWLGGRAYFFSRTQRKYSNKYHRSRSTPGGYWQPTGKGSIVRDGEGKTIGFKKILEFYIGRAPNGTRTGWVMHEYTANLELAKLKNPKVDNIVLCKVFCEAAGKCTSVINIGEDQDLEEVPSRLIEGSPEQKPLRV